MARKRLLVIVPHAELRNSVAFALAAEGHAVDVSDTIMAHFPRSYDAIVADEAALEEGAEAFRAFCRESGRVILLADAPIPWLAGTVAGTIQKPALGSALVAAVQAVLDRLEGTV